MRKFCIFLIVFVLFTSVSCKAKNNGEYKVEGLTDEIYYKFSGSWDNWTDVNKDDFEFSWGSGKWVHNHSIIIDFGCDTLKSKLDFEPPYFYIGGLALFNILSVEVIVEDEYHLHLQNRNYPERKGYFIIHTDVDGAIWFENNPEFDYLIDGPDEPYYRISVPKE